MSDYVMYQNQILGIIIRNSYVNKGVTFFTPQEFSQQLAYMSHPQGRIIDSHTHTFHLREIQITQEVLIIKRGKIRVDFYDDDQNYIESRILQAGDIILLASGGHGFEVLEELEMIEVKQGPYSNECDKQKFTPVPVSQLNIK